MNAPTTTPLVTTVIPTYRRPVWLQRAIQSVLQQSYPHILVLVCDNASNDETEKIVQRLAEKDSRVRYYRHATNVGSYNNFNYGIRSVTTPFFSLLSDDDVLLPDFYRRTLEALEHFQEAMFACMSTMVMDSDGNVVSAPALVERIRLNGAAEGLLEQQLRPIPQAWTAILFRTQVRDEIGLIDTDAGPFADGAFVMHAAARFPFVDVPGVGAVLMSHQASMSGTVKPLNGEWLQWWTDMIHRIEVDGKVPQRAKARLRSKEVMDIAAFDFRKVAVQQVMKSLSAGNLEYAYRAAAGAKECGHPFVSWLLTVLVRIERGTRLVRPVLRLTRSVRRVLRRRLFVQLNRRFAHERIACKGWLGIMNQHLGLETQGELV